MSPFLSLVSLLNLSIGGDKYRMRPFDPRKDQARLEEICEHVYDGTDYLPSVAASLASDPLSAFVVLADERDDRSMAVANLRNFLPGKMWLEAVRTCDTRRNRGLARALTRTLVERAVEDGNEVLTCTVDKNVAMRKILEAAGMRSRHRIHLCSFAKMRALPGWGADDIREPNNLLRSVGAEAIIGEEPRAMRWSPIGSRAELDEILERIEYAGGCGHIPAPWELLGDNSIESALRGGMIFSSCSGKESAVLSLVRDEKIQSLKSKWVCSVAATSTIALEAALWYASSEELVSARNGDVAFALAFDGAVPVNCPGSICSLLPLVDDACLVYSSRTTKI